MKMFSSPYCAHHSHGIKAFAFETGGFFGWLGLDTASLPKDVTDLSAGLIN